MAQYYFALSDHHGRVDDRPEGMDLPNLQSARAHAIAVARELARNIARAKLHGQVLAVLDGDGRKLLDFPLGDIPST